VHVIFDDARDFLLTSRDKYDLIISEPSNPWIAGVATLFTDEYYAAARQRLAPGGMFVQWVQSYSLAPVDLRMIMATFARHFPEVTLWRAGETDLLLLGRAGLSPLRFDHIRSLWQNAGLRQDFTSMDIHRPEGLAAYFLLDDLSVRRLARGSVLNTDDRTLLEYHAPRSLLAADMIDADKQLIERFRDEPLPPNLEPSEVGSALHAGLATALDLNDGTGAQTVLKALDSEPDSAAREIGKGRLALIQGALPYAKQCLEAAFGLDPNSPEAAYWLAAVERRSGDDASALSHIEAALKLDPHYLPALESEMKLAADKKDFQTALSAQLSRMALMPNPPAYEYGRLGALWLGTSNFANAESVLLKGLAKDAYCYACHLELGELYIRTDRLRLARQNYEWVVRFFPDSDPVAFQLLAGIDVSLRDTHAARAVLNEGLRLFPVGQETYWKGVLSHDLEPNRALRRGLAHRT
jgi:tetratricopeptide (TPR) repeat protein